MAMVDAGKNMVGIIPDDVNGGNWIAFSAGTRTGMTACLAKPMVYVVANEYAGHKASAELKLLANPQIKLYVSQFCRLPNPGLDLLYSRTMTASFQKICCCYRAMRAMSSGRLQ